MWAGAPRYDIRIVTADNGAARVRAEDGAEAVYTGGADGSYEAPAGRAGQADQGSPAAGSWCRRTGGCCGSTAPAS